MAELTVRANLNSALVPLATELWGRSIIIPGADMNYDKTTLNLPNVVVDKGLPQVFYMHNCMPTVQGYQSVGYRTYVPALMGSSDFGAIIPLQLSTGQRLLLSPSSGKNYIYDGSDGFWHLDPVNLSGTVPPDVLVTSAYVHGETYIYYANVGCYKYDYGTLQLVPVVLTGLVAADIIGIAASGGYLIAWTKTVIAWSSLTNPLDFVPSLATGAGSGSGEEVEGDINFITSVSNGIIVYAGNAVFGKSTSNEQFPFAFKEIPGSAGVDNIYQIAFQGNLGYNIVRSSNGIQKFDGLIDTAEFNELSDFLAARIFEDFNEITLQLSSEYLGFQLFSSIQFIGARYLVLSYGKDISNFTHAIVYDLMLKRYGKLKLDHVACFEWNFPTINSGVTYGDLMTYTYADLSQTTYDSLSSTVNPRQTNKDNFCFITSNGEVKAVNFDISETTADGVLIIGKYQMQRNIGIEHQICEVDTVGDFNIFNYYVLPSYDGKTLAPPVKAFQAVASRMRRCMRFTSGLNISSLFIGQFNLVSLVYTFTSRGADV